MKDEDFSELAEALEQACETAEKNGYTVSSWDIPGHVSPWGALLRNGRSPYPETVQAMTGIPAALVGAFNQGFGGSKRHPWFSVKSHALGVQFRERWMSKIH